MAAHSALRAPISSSVAVCIVAVFAVVIGLAGEATAQPVAKDTKLEAKARFMSGQSHYNLNEFPEALSDFKDAYRLFPDPVFLYNVGQCERQLGHFEEAIRFYRNFLREQPKAPNKQEVLHKIEEMESAIEARPEAAETVPEVPSTDQAAQPAAAPAAAAPSGTPEQPAAATNTPNQPAAPNQAHESARTAPLPAPAAPVPAEGSGPRIDLTSQPTQSAPAAVSFYQRWWFWPAVAAVAIGTGVGIYAATTGKSPAAPTTDLGTKKVF